MKVAHSDLKPDNILLHIANEEEFDIEDELLLDKA
jgi:serine/threonine protein kinase